MNRTLRPLVALVIASLLGVGCSQAPADTDSASTVDDKSADKREQGVKFAKCIRENGVSDFPDPHASGELTIDATANGSSLDPSTAAFTQP